MSALLGHLFLATLSISTYIFYIKVWTKRTCELCNLLELEDAKHLILNCPNLNDIRRDMFTALSESCNSIGKHVLDSNRDLYALFLG